MMNAEIASEMTRSRSHTPMPVTARIGGAAGVAAVGVDVAGDEGSPLCAVDARSEPVSGISISFYTRGRGYNVFYPRIQ